MCMEKIKVNYPKKCIICTFLTAISNLITLVPNVW